MPDCQFDFTDDTETVIACVVHPEKPYEKHRLTPENREKIIWSKIEAGQWAGRNMEEPMEEKEQEQPVEQVPAERDSAPSSALVLIDAYKAAGTMRLSKEQEAILLAPIDEEKEVDVHPVDGPFIPWLNYTQRLNRAFGMMGWALLRMGDPSSDFDNDKETVAIRVVLKIEGRAVRDAVGSFTYTSSKMTRFDALEAAMKNGLKRCCSLLGMFSEMQDKTWKEQWLRTYAVQEEETSASGKKYKVWRKRTQRPMPTPQKTVLPKVSELQTEAQVIDVRGPTSTGAWSLVLAHDDNHTVELLGNECLKKYPDPRELKDLFVFYTTKEVPQKGGGKMTVLNTIEVQGL